ncbi:hypothetical protein DFR29_12642 [Tahibacter aquaticus]|uniref:Uncharacterized protein n=1 Tax=Tahibacter aquaticus TaxID=520092 RepID=A0A4R6YJ64_9GAMM|nr:hypothetical protein DFR29_12642 [Tahibacter aquaticus]
MRNGLPTIGPSTKDSAPENVTLCTTSVPAAVSLSSCSNSIRKSGILDSTVNDLSGTTEMKFIGTAIPLAGVIRPWLPVWNGPSIDDALVSGSQIFQLLTSAYISNIFLGGTEIMMRLSTCTRALQGRLKFARRNLPLQRGAEFLLLSLAKVSTVTGGTRLKSCQPVSVEMTCRPEVAGGVAGSALLAIAQALRGGPIPAQIGGPVQNFPDSNADTATA